MRTHIAVIPAYQPDQVLVDVTGAMVSRGFSVVIVDDGSDPACNAFFQEAGQQAVVLHHEKNRGKGAALRTALQYIADNFSGEYTVVTVDADGQHKADDAVRVTEEADAHPSALVLGRRDFTQKVPFKSAAGNTSVRILFMLSTGKRLYDTQTGLRAFTGDLIPEMLAIPGNRYEYEMNVLLDFAGRKKPILEVGIETIYVDGNAKTHFRPFLDSVRICRDILKFSASSLIGFLTDILFLHLFLFLFKDIPFCLELSNVSARVISASVNFTLNRVLVFHSKKPLIPTLLEYALLAVTILILNTLLLKLLAEVLGIQVTLAKIITEITMFSLSFLVQKLFIFRRKTGDKA